MGWAADAYGALKKVILIEDRIAKMAEELKKLGDLYMDVNSRVTRLETKIEVYEDLSRIARDKRRLK